MGETPDNIISRDHLKQKIMIIDACNNLELIDSLIYPSVKNTHLD